MLDKYEIGKSIKKKRMQRGLTAIELAEKANVAKSSLSEWENGKSSPSAEAVFRICKVLNIQPSELTENNYVNDYDDFPFKNIQNIQNIPNLVPITTKKVPILGKIACGDPIEAIEHIEYYAEVDSNLKIDAGLIAQGDSMINARIYDGDTVFIHYQPTVENGEIAAVKIDGDVTLKRFYYDQKTDMVTLVAENPKYAPYIYKKSDNKLIQIVGKALTFQGIIK